MDNCKKCGALLRVSASYCNSCGGSVLNSEATVQSVPEFLVQEQQNIMKKAWGEFYPLLILYSSILFILFFSFVIRESNPLNNVITWSIILSVTIYFGSKYKDYLVELFKIHRIPLKYILEIFALSVLVYFFMKMYFLSFKILHFHEIKATTAILEYNWPIWSAFVLISVCPGILEEIIFRGIIYSKLKDLFEVKEALIIQAACFSVLHLSPLIFISHFIMGLFFGWVRERTKSLYPPMIFHMGWNAYIVWLELNKIKF